ncbi:MAG: prolipoprotein diacylglyceryl transferase family protein [Flavobacteriales bacterium]
MFCFTPRGQRPISGEGIGEDSALAIPLNGIFIRLGNFMNLEIIGISTHSDYSFIFQWVDALSRHLVQL